MSGCRQRRQVPGRGRAPGRQRGLSLITALLFMVATLILGVSVMSINVMQERMIGNTKDHDLAMQAAEAALRDAELDVSENIGAATLFKEDCENGLCIPPSKRATPSPLPVHAVAGFDWTSDAKVRKYRQYTNRGARPIAEFPTVASQPRYVIERLGAMGNAGNSVVVGFSSSSDGGTAYRITARATGARGDTVVILQSIYARR